VVPRSSAKRTSERRVWPPCFWTRPGNSTPASTHPAADLCRQKADVRRIRQKQHADLQEPARLGATSWLSGSQPLAIVDVALHDLLKEKVHGFHNRLASSR